MRFGWLKFCGTGILLGSCNLNPQPEDPGVGRGEVPDVPGVDGEGAAGGDDTAEPVVADASSDAGADAGADEPTRDGGQE